MKKSVIVKRFIIAFLLLFTSITGVYALRPEVESGKGPVKQITVTIRTDDADMYYVDAAGAMGTMAKVVIWYDSVGRMIEHAEYMGGMLLEGYVCQYNADTACVQYEYNSSGLVDGSFAVIRYDSNGRQVSSRRYRDGVFVLADSIVYNTLGQKAEQYDTPYKVDSLTLKFVYTYDSSGRLIKVEDVKYGQENSYMIEYLPDGNYVEHHINKQGKEWLRKYFVNKKGELIKKEDKNSIVRYSKFDKYGNWLVSESTSKDDPRGDTSITERKIEYFE